MLGSMMAAHSCAAKMRSGSCLKSVTLTKPLRQKRASRCRASSLESRRSRSYLTGGKSICGIGSNQQGLAASRRKEQLHPKEGHVTSQQAWLAFAAAATIHNSSCLETVVVQASELGRVHTYMRRCRSGSRLQLCCMWIGFDPGLDATLAGVGLVTGSGQHVIAGVLGMLA
jgi:hypothetical protein